MDMNLKQAQTNMLGQQIRAWHTVDKQALDLMANILRTNFVPPKYTNLAYSDSEIPLGNFDLGEYMLAPKIIGRMLQEIIKLKSLDCVLEIGTGSGYFTALLQQVAHKVVTIDISYDMYALAQANFANNNLPQIEQLHGNAIGSIPSSLSFDCIVLTGSVEIVPEAIFTKIKPRGSVLAFVGKKPITRACLFTKTENGTWHKQDLFDTYISPLLQFPALEKFKF